METENKECVKVIYKVYDKNNNLIQDGSIEKDIVVNSGLSFRAALLGGLISPALCAVAIGTGTVTPKPTDTALGAEVMRTTSTNVLKTTNVTNDTLSVSANFTFSSAVSISEFGTFNTTNANEGIMYSHDLIGPLSMQQGYTLQLIINFIQLN
ncbi:MAG: hypothetical protein ACP5MB_10295 [bacterium]